MKKIVLLMILLFSLSSCSNENVPVEEDNDNLVDSDIIEDRNFDGFSNLEDYFISFVYEEKYFTFKDMIDDSNGDFYYGKVVSIEDYNFAVDKVYFEVYQSNLDCDEVINISIEKNSPFFEEDQEYVVHLTYNEEYDYYSLSDVTKSIFTIDGDEVSYHEYFVDELDKDVNKKLTNLLKKVFE